MAPTAESILQEQGYLSLMKETKEGEYFYDVLVQRGWDKLLHSGGEIFYPDLVKQFFDNITDSNLQNFSFKTTVLGHPLEVSFDLIQEITQIPSLSYFSHGWHTEQIDRKILLGVLHPTDHSSKITVEHLFRNQLATFRWLCSNVLPSTHRTTIYDRYVILLCDLQFNTRKVSVNRLLIQSMLEVHIDRQKEKSKTKNYVLPVLISSIIRTKIGLPSEAREKAISKVNLGPAFRSCVNDYWNPTLRCDEGNTSGTQVDSDSSDERFLETLEDMDMKAGFTKLFKKVRKQGKAQVKIQATLDEIKTSMNAQVALQREQNELFRQQLELARSSGHNP